MITKSLGALVALLGVGSCLFGVYALIDGVEMGKFLAIATADSDAPVDSSDWARHWQLSSSVMLAWGLGLVVSGVGLWRRRPWSLLVLSVAAATLVAIQLASRATGYAKYAYELPGVSELVFLGIVAVVSLVGYTRWRNSTAVR